MGRLADAIGAVFLGYGCLLTTRGTTISGCRPAARGGARRSARGGGFEALKHAADNVPKMPAGAHHGGVRPADGRRAAGRRGHDEGPTTPDQGHGGPPDDAGLDYVSTLLLPGVYTSGAYQKEVPGALSLCLEAYAIERACKRARKHPTADEQATSRPRPRGRIVQVRPSRNGHAERAPGHVRRRSRILAGSRRAGARGRRRLNPPPLPPLVATRLGWSFASFARYRPPQKKQRLQQPHDKRHQPPYSARSAWTAAGSGPRGPDGAPLAAGGTLGTFRSTVLKAWHALQDLR